MTGWRPVNANVGERALVSQGDEQSINHALKDRCQSASISRKKQGIDETALTTVGTQMQEKPARPILSPRQNACLRLAATGNTSPEIARTLGISPRTVDQHIEDARARLNVRTRIEAVVLATKYGLIVDEPFTDWYGSNYRRRAHDGLE